MVRNDASLSRLLTSEGQPGLWDPGAGEYLGNDLWGGDNVTDEGSSGLGRTVSNGAGAV